MTRAHTSMPGKRPPRVIVDRAVEDAVESAADVDQAMSDMNRRYQLTMEPLAVSPTASSAIHEVLLLVPPRVCNQPLCG